MINFEVPKRDASTAHEKISSTLDNMKNVKEEGGDQKKRISSLEKKILETKLTVKGEQKKLSPDQKEILKRFDEAAKKLETTALRGARSDVKKLKKETKQFTKEIEQEKKSIENSLDKIKTLASGSKGWKIWKDVSSPKAKEARFFKADTLGTEATLKANNAEVKHTTIKNSQWDSNKKIEGIEKNLKYIQSAGDRRLSIAIDVHNEYRKVNDEVKNFSALANKLESKTINGFDGKLNELKDKLNELKKLEEDLGTSAIRPTEQAEERFTDTTFQVHANLGSEIAILKQEIIQLLNSGVSKPSLRARIATLASMAISISLGKPVAPRVPETTAKENSPLIYEDLESEEEK